MRSLKKVVAGITAVGIVLVVSLVMAAPVLAAATGSIADNDLTAQVIGMTKTKCVQKVTITNPIGAGNLDIDCFAVTNGGSALDADVTQVAVYHDTNPADGTWQATDAQIGTAAHFTAATAIGDNDDAACLSVVKDTTEVVFVVVTTAAGPTDGRTFLTTIDGIDLVGASTDAWAAPPAEQATATSATTIDAVAPTAIVTTTVDPIFEGALVQTVNVTYDESMNPATTPGITLTGTHWGAQAAGAWDTAVFANDRYTTTFTHDGIQEEIAAEVATVAGGSGATDVADNADVGDASPPFVVDTLKPTATVTTTVDPISEGARVQTVIVTYTESMDPAPTPVITLTGTHWGAQTNVGWSQTVFANDTFTATFTHDGTQEGIAAEVATVASGSGATDVAGNADVGDASPPFAVATQKPPAPEQYVGTAATPRTYLFGITSGFRITSKGEIIDTIQATSEDDRVAITIPKGTFALDKHKNALSTLTARPCVSPPSPPEGANIIGPAYDFGPDRATFDPPITFEYKYDPADIPEGVNEEDLVLAYYDTEAGKWVELESVVDTKTHTITADEVSHFTTFAILGREVALPSVIPAAFTTSDLVISPGQVNVGESVNIGATVANTGGESGSYKITLSIDDVVEATKDVTVGAGASEEVSFTISKDMAGTYLVHVNNDLTGSFVVKEKPVPSVPTPTPTTPTPTPTPTPEPTNWPLIGGITGGVIVVALLIFFLIRRRVI